MPRNVVFMPPQKKLCENNGLAVWQPYFFFNEANKGVSLVYVCTVLGRDREE